MWSWAHYELICFGFRYIASPKSEKQMKIHIPEIFFRESEM